MDTYDCYYLQGNTEYSKVTIVANSDAEALLRAEELVSDSRFTAMAVRNGSRLVGQVTLGTPAALLAVKGRVTPPSRDKTR